MTTSDSSRSSVLRAPLFLLAIFWGVGLWRYLATGTMFYLFNFGYIGTTVAGSVLAWNILPGKKRQWARRACLVLVGGYMLGYLGIIRHENMQLEGFFFYLAAGVFAGATLHYFVGKMLIPLLWGRAWCGWACWTAALLDLLPWKEASPRHARFGLLRYVHFGLSLVLVGVLFTLGVRPSGQVELAWLGAGNATYYLVAVFLAWRLKDNRAFCKYLCPVVVPLKLSRFARSKMAVNMEECVECGQCEKYCPMGIELLAYAREGMRVESTECIFCQTCASVCPTGAVTVVRAWGMGGPEKLRIMGRES